MAGNVFTGGKGLFTAWDPGSALRVNPPPTWVAVMPDKMTPELAQAFKDRGIALVIWEPEASQAGVDAVNRYGAAGYIAQAEGPEQLAAANAIGGQIHVPKALVTNNFMPHYPPGWIAMPEAYTNNDPNATADQVTRDALARGATEVVPVIGLGFVDTPDGRQVTAAEYQAGLDRAGAAGATGSAAYISEQASDQDLNAYTSGKVPSGTQPPGGGQQGQGQPAPPPKPTPTPTTPPPPSGPPSDVLPGRNPFDPVYADAPPPPYQQGVSRGPQTAEGGLGENWNLGWEGVAPPQGQQRSPGSASPLGMLGPVGAPKTGGGFTPGWNPGDAGPPLPTMSHPPIPAGPQNTPGASLYLNPQSYNALMSNLPYLNRAIGGTTPPYRWS